jgi:transposase
LVSPSFSVKLVARHARTGSLEPAPQGRPPRTGKLDPYRAFLIGRVQAKPDITMPELAAELAARHGVEVDPASLSRLLCKAGFSYKKNAARQRARALWRRQRAPLLGCQAPAHHEDHAASARVP